MPRNSRAHARSEPHPWTHPGRLQAHGSPSRRSIHGSSRLGSTTPLQIGTGLNRSLQRRSRFGQNAIGTVPRQRRNPSPAAAAAPYRVPVPGVSPHARRSSHRLTFLDSDPLVDVRDGRGQPWWGRHRIRARRWLRHRRVHRAPLAEPVLPPACLVEPPWLCSLQPREGIQTEFTSQPPHARQEWRARACADGTP